MANFNIIERVADVAAECFLDELVKMEDFDSFELLVTTDMRDIAARVLTKCIERFDAKLRESPPRGWTCRERASRTLITLVGEINYKRTVFIDQYGRRRMLADELLGIPPRSRLSANAFLWVAAHAAELSYRKTAASFKLMTSVPLSHVSVMNVVHKEGALLKESGGEFANADVLKISQDVLFVEADGLWVHEQAHEHRKHALPRFLYEQAKKTRSFELKIAALYAGKAKVAQGRYKRGGLCLTCADEAPDVFWERVWRMLCENYEEKDVERIAVGADGAEWCGSERIEEKASEGVSVDFTLDLFHVMKKITQGFAQGPKRDWAIHLALRGKGKSLARMCARAGANMPAGSKREKVEELATYVANHIEGIRPPARELGTMEATNAYVGAARLKGQGRSWSRAGAEAMCLIRCALATGRPLVAPKKAAWFSEPELAKARAALPRSAAEVALSVGAGKAYPHTCGPLTKKVSISLAARS